MINWYKAIIPKRYKAGEPYFEIEEKYTVVTAIPALTNGDFDGSTYLYNIVTATGSYVSFRHSELPITGKSYWIYRKHYKRHFMIFKNVFLPNHLLVYPKYKPSTTHCYIK